MSRHDAELRHLFRGSRTTKSGGFGILGKEWQYIAPELLPEWPEAQASLLAGRIPKDQPVAEAHPARLSVKNRPASPETRPFTGNTVPGLTRRPPMY
jgi:hypothetical protein